MGSGPRPSIDELLAHREWVRRVARALVGDPDRAEDLEQDLWVSVLERPGEAPRRSPRRWLAGALRFKAIDRWRSEARRRRRESDAARPPSVAPAEDAIARGEVLRRVVQAVMDLDEPYRSTVLLRYFEGLAPTEIAAQQGVSRETVHTRLGRALAKLRSRLDVEHDGDRRAWLPLLLPLARGIGGDGSAAPSLGSVGTAAAAAAGGVVMGMKVKGAVVASAFLVAAVVAFVAGWALLDLAGPDGDADPHETAKSPRARARAPALRNADAGAADEASAAAAASATAPEEAPGRPRGTLRGLVVGPDGCTPVAGASLEIRPFGGPAPDGMTPPVVPLRRRTSRSGADGRFVVEDVPVGAWRVAAAHPEFGRALQDGVASVDPAWMLVRLEVPRTPLPLRLRLVDAEGRPVPGATVQALRALDRPFASTGSDAEGRARLEGFGQGASLVVATGDGVAAQVFVSEHHRNDRLQVQATRESEPTEAFPDDEVPLLLLPTGVLTGRVTAPGGADVAGVVVQAWTFTNEWLGWHNGGTHREAVVGADGAYRLEGLPAAAHVLLVSNGRGLRVAARIARDEHDGWLGPPHLVLPRVEVAAGRETAFDLALERGGTVRGRVHRSDGTPVAGARVELHLPLGNFDNEENVQRGGAPLWRFDSEPIPDERRHPASWIVTTSAADGTYEASGLIGAATWRVRVVPSADLSFDLQHPVSVEDGGCTELRHPVEPAGTLEAVLPQFGAFGLRRTGESQVVASFISSRGSGAVRIPALAAGTWEVLQFRGANVHEALVPPLTFAIAPGAVTVLDASGAGLPLVTVRYVDEGRPVSRVRTTSIYTSGARFSDADGVVVLREWAGRNSFGSGSEVPTTNLSYLAPAPGAVPLSGGNVPVESAGPAGEWRTTVEIPSGSLAVRLRQPDGRPWPGANVRLEPVPAPGEYFRRSGVWSVGSSSRLTGRDGVGLFATLPAGHYRWSADLPDGGLRGGTVALADPETKEIDVTGEATGSLRVTVRTADGKPAAGAVVHVVVLRAETDPGPDAPDRWDRPQERVAGIPRTGADGVVVIRGLVRGTASVVAGPRHADARRDTPQPSSATVEVPIEPPAESVVTLELPPER